jgi:uncharacterized membrane protein YfhO
MGYGYRAYDRVAGAQAEQFNTETSVIRQIEGTDDFYRYSGTGLSGNASVQDGAPSTQFYWSLANGYVSDFFEEMGLCYSYGNAFAGFDDRAILDEIAAVKDFYTQEENHVPFGYDLLDETENPAASQYPVYRNRYTLPLGITLPALLSRDTYEALDVAARQEVLLTHAVTDELPEQCPVPETGSEDIQPALTRTVQPFTMSTPGDRVRIEGTTFTALEDGAKVRFTFAGTPDSETYLYLADTDYQAKSIPERLSFTVKA